MLVLMPLFMMVMVGFIFPSGGSISATPIALANLDNGSMGTSFITQLNTINNKTRMMELSTVRDSNPCWIRHCAVVNCCTDVQESDEQVEFILATAYILFLLYFI